MPGPDPTSVDLIVAVHDARRRVDRAVASVLDGTQASVRVTVVCHDLEPGPVVSALGALADDARVRVVAFADGVRSPAGPYNHGLDLATGEFTSVLGSDDVLDRRAVDSWVATARSASAEVVVARVRYDDGAPMRTPPARPLRSRQLDGVRDRLAYRSAPLGLVSRARFGRLRFTPRVPVGEDIAYSNALWFSGARLVLDRGPAYVVTDDAADRVTFRAKPVDEELAFLPTVLADLARRGPAAARAYATKFLRVQGFGAVHNRPEASSWTPVERAALSEACRRVLALAPGAAAPLSIADRRLLGAVLDVDAPVGDLLGLARARRRFGTPATLVPLNPAFLLHREAPLRFMAASVLAGRPGGRGLPRR